MSYLLWIALDIAYPTQPQERPLGGQASSISTATILLIIGVLALAAVAVLLILRARRSKTQNAMPAASPPAASAAKPSPAASPLAANAAQPSTAASPQTANGEEPIATAAAPKVPEYSADQTAPAAAPVPEDKP